MLVTNENELTRKENNKMKKLGKKIITKATVIAAAASLMIGGTQVFDSFAASSEWSNTCSGFGINK